MFSCVSFTAYSSTGCCYFAVARQPAGLTWLSLRSGELFYPRGLSWPKGNTFWLCCARARVCEWLHPDGLD